MIIVMFLIIVHAYFCAATLDFKMSVIYLLLSISIIIAIVFFAAFIFAVKNGQYDDGYTPSVRMLFEDEIVKKEKIKSKLTTKNNK